tara:strand:- start:129 stop:485 length:357 start_codon:yes stop_codon:yes gene_type:complete
MDTYKDTFTDTAIRDIYINEYIDDVYFDAVERDSDNNDWIDSKEFKTVKKAFEDKLFEYYGERYKEIKCFEPFDEIIRILIEENIDIMKALETLCIKYYYIEEKEFGKEYKIGQGLVE